MSTELQRTCPSCGNEFSGAVEFCPVCMLRKALAGEVECSESFAEDAVVPTSERMTQRFEHYELAKDEDGKPVELGRGAMGITYKAFDIDLRCAVTLKMIKERNLRGESARLRFLREARAAASVRHPNVASVFHLGKSGGNYFYAMEFVEGETLEGLIRGSSRLEVKLALEIAAQVTAGLTAIHKQKLVHRDIKPSNIMVNFEDEGAVTAKIIDLGLAKAVNEAGSQTAISMPGGFAGTPEFASPEQFAGVGTDIRSDLYSLGVVLWEMLTGHMLFRGSPAEVMHQHLHAPLPLDLLEAVPQPVVVLLDVLLEKDPGRRFQSPAELLQAMPTITDAIDARRRITRQSLQKAPSTAPRFATRKLPARRGPKKISVARLPVTGRDVFGREEDVAFLNEAALTWFGDRDSRIGTAWEKGERLAKLISHRRTVLVLDGLEPLQNPPGPQEGRLRDPSLQALLRELAAFNSGLCVITTRLPVADIARHEGISAPRRELEQLSSDAGAKLLRALGVKGDQAELRSASEEFSGHCLAQFIFSSPDVGVYPRKRMWRARISLRKTSSLFMQAELYLAGTRGFSVPEVRICYERMESFSHSLNRPVLLYAALLGQWRYSLVTDKLTATVQIAKRIYSLAQEQNDSSLMIGAFRVMTGTLYWLGDFEASRKYAIRGLQIWDRAVFSSTKS
jgi:serine/threonine protein kinase